MKERVGYNIPCPECHTPVLFDTFWIVKDDFIATFTCQHCGHQAGVNIGQLWLTLSHETNKGNGEVKQ